MIRNRSRIPTADLRKCLQTICETVSSSISSETRLKELGDVTALDCPGHLRPQDHLLYLLPFTFVVYRPSLLIRVAYIPLH